MKKFALPLFVVIAFVVAIAFATSAFAGGQCCTKISTACKASSGNTKSTSTTGNSAAVSARPVKASATSSSTANCATTAQCNGKACGPCDPSDCKGAPCDKCDLSKCPRSCAQPTSASKSAL